jgi:predicted pyridoxine 5'-phosphate oxidase superfamily flavin-nucleotide-binding protein
MARRRSERRLAVTKPTSLNARGKGHAVFHEGELAVQEATGERAIAERNSRMMYDTVPPAPASFLAQQRMLVVASVDETGAPAASLIFGPAGFASTSHGETVTLERAHTEIAPGDALLGNLRVGGMLGLLAIELGSRRRYRINGFVSSLTEERIELAVREAYVNCPKYIQRRHLRVSDEPPQANPEIVSGDVLDPERQALISRADTMFVASRHPTRGADASHRGGEPGFLEIRDECSIRVPEYAGNGLYNTLGNLIVSSQAGLAVVDFDAGRVLQLSGFATVVLEAPHEEGPGDVGRATGAGAVTGRYWDFTVSRWTELSLPKIFRWELLDRSPFNPPLST